MGPSSPTYSRLDPIKHWVNSAQKKPSPSMNGTGEPLCSSKPRSKPFILKQQGLSKEAYTNNILFSTISMWDGVYQAYRLQKYLENFVQTPKRLEVGSHWEIDQGRFFKPTVKNQNHIFELRTLSLSNSEGFNTPLNSIYRW